MKKLPASRIMWIENKSSSDEGGLAGPARIGRVTFSKTGKSIYYKGRTLQSLGGRGFKYNYVDMDSKECFWISGCHKDGADALYNTNVEIDEDVREEYWTQVRQQPGNAHVSAFRAKGKCG